jgi:hypothetical protein
MKYLKQTANAISWSIGFLREAIFSLGLVLLLIFSIAYLLVKVFG